MPDLKQVVQALRNGKLKGNIKRDAFLYMESHDDDPDFAQCKTCCLMTPDNKCTILDMRVAPGWTCGLYVPGAYDGSEVNPLVTAEEAGLFKGTVRCENCRYGGDNCQLYERLNKSLPEQFDLDTKIKALACCNAFQGK